MRRRGSGPLERKRTRGESSTHMCAPPDICSDLEDLLAMNFQTVTWQVSPKLFEGGTRAIIEGTRKLPDGRMDTASVEVDLRESVVGPGKFNLERWQEWGLAVIQQLNAETKRVA
jgi:hypothetical protein